MFEILSICRDGGYRYCRTNPPHPKRNAKGLYPLHRVLVENKLGRLLKPGEEIHHVDEVKENDDPSNLEVKTKADHTRLHNSRPRRRDWYICRCGKTFFMIPSVYARRLDRSKTGELFCSQKCQHESMKRSCNRGGKVGSIPTLRNL